MKKNPHKRVCHIFGAGERVSAEALQRPADGDLVIAADGGYSWVTELASADEAFLADIFVGDFDSAAESAAEIRERCGKTGTTVVELPVVKDDTDTGVCVQEGAKRGYKTFYIYGGTGGRWDHTIANLQLLTHIAREGGRGFLIGAELCATTVNAGEKITIAGKPGGHLSVFSAGGNAEGVSIRGAKYETEDVTLRDDYALGVSNSFTAPETSIACKKGTLLVTGEFLPKDVS